MADLTARLTEALDQAEEQARAVKLPDGWYTPEDLTRPHPSGAGLADFDGAHIATWSPERVLALIHRDRALLADHRLYLSDEFGYQMCAADGQLWPCDDVERVAAFWLPDPKEIR